MILSKVLSKYQVTLPKEAVQAVGIRKGDILKCQIEKGKITFIPVVIEEPYSEEEFRKFEELYRQPANKGKVYKTKHDAMNHLKRLHADR